MENVGLEAPPSSARVSTPAKLGLGVLLTAVAGSVDAIGFLALGGFFASFMSGASISLGISMSESRWVAALDGAVLILVFLAGAVIATILTEVANEWGLPTALTLEGCLLGGAAVLARTGWEPSVAIIPVVAAMGVQNTTLRPVEGVRLGVTFMTGTLVSLGQGLGRAILGRSRVRTSAPHALLWCAFAAGAGAGASLYAVFGFAAVAGPAALVGAMSAAVAVAGYVKRRPVGPPAARS
jgi:uncharacterized membrane protein YoaK (UPF0700 family)